jgi:hypothetical protein
VPGITALNVPGGNAGVNTPSCLFPKDCTAGGFYISDTNSPPWQALGPGQSAFVVTETWLPAQNPVPPRWRLLLGSQRRSAGVPVEPERLTVARGVLQKS